MTPLENTADPVEPGRGAATNFPDRSAFRGNEPEEESLVHKVRHATGFAMRAVKRNPGLSSFVFLAGLAFSVLIAAAWPKVYRSEVHLLAQPNRILPNLSNPHRPIPYDADAPTRAASEAITRQDNLVALVQDLDLVDAFERGRSPILRWKDQMLNRMGRPIPTRDNQVRAMVDILENRLKVKTDTDQIVVSVDWPDRDMAYRIVTQAQKNFLDGRFSSQMAMISESIAILESEMRKERTNMDAAMADVLRLAQKNLARNQPAPAPMMIRPAAAAKGRRPLQEGSAAAHPAPAPETRNYALEIAQLNERLVAKRATMRELDDPRQQSLNELRRQLADLRLSLNGSHPQVIALERRIRELSVDPPELTRLRADERELTTQIEKLSTMNRPAPREVVEAEQVLAATAPANMVQPSAPESANFAAAPAPKAPTGPSLAERAPGVPWAADDEPIELLAAREKLQTAIKSYSDLKDRADAARIELVSEQAAFKYRYTVIKPAEEAKEPLPPYPWMLLLAGALGSMALAAVIASLRDISTGRVIEPWQVERRIGLPVLAEVRLP